MLLTGVKRNVPTCSFDDLLWLCFRKQFQPIPVNTAAAFIQHLHPIMKQLYFLSERQSSLAFIISSIILHGSVPLSSARLHSHLATRRQILLLLCCYSWCIIIQTGGIQCFSCHRQNQLEPCEPKHRIQVECTEGLCATFSYKQIEGLT